jgi:diguanylate cyclase (GGDEF)-like protein
MNALNPVEPAPVSSGHSLIRRLVAATLLVSLGISALVIAVQLLYAWSAGLDAARGRLDEIGESIAPTLAASLWQVDTDRVNLLLDGIKHFPRVSYVDLKTSEGERFERGDAQAEVLLERTYPLQYGSPNPYALGTLRVVLGRRQLVEQLTGQASAIALATAVTLGFSSLLMLLLFRRRVTRHITAMADYARTLSVRRLDAPLALSGKAERIPPDELDQLVASFNQMRQTLRTELLLRDRDQAELLLHRERLETLVQARTAELAEKTDLLQQQKDEMQRLANTDSLTGVNSRRHFNELAEREIARSGRSGEPLSVLALDIDHFKRINDQHGHDIGDLAIIRFCVNCSRHLRQLDVIGRVGGEEFAILLPGTDAANARLVAERIRATLSADAVETPRGPLRFTVSIGIASRRDINDDIAALLKRADEAMYRAKQEGRDRVCSAPDPLIPS